MTIRLSLLALAVLARAAVAQPVSAAQPHIDAADAAFQKGEFEEALKELRIAYTLDKQPELLYAIGQVYVRMGNCADAVTFYGRFLDTNPDPDKASKASEAIETCKKLLAEQKPPPPPPPPPPPSHPAVPTEVDRPPWYSDWLADGLVGLGAIAGGGAIGVTVSAHKDRDRADSRSSYDKYNALIEHANTKQRVGFGLAAASAALVAGGVVRYLFHRDRDRETAAMSVTVPSRGAGGVVTWGTRF